MIAFPFTRDIALRIYSQMVQHMARGVVGSTGAGQQCFSYAPAEGELQLPTMWLHYGTLRITLKDLGAQRAEWYL